MEAKSSKRRKGTGSGERGAGSRVGGVDEPGHVSLNHWLTLHKTVRFAEKQAKKSRVAGRRKKSKFTFGKMPKKKKG